MPQQLSFAHPEHLAKKKRTRRDVFLAELERLVSWQSLLELIQPYCYHEASRGQRCPLVRISTHRSAFP